MRSEILFAALFLLPATSRDRTDLATFVEARINRLIGQMTLSEKVAVCMGADVGVAQIVPSGAAVRGSGDAEGVPCTHATPAPRPGTLARRLV